MILSDHTVISQCMGHQLITNGVICSSDKMVNTKYLDSDTSYLIEEKDQKHLV